MGSNKDFSISAEFTSQLRAIQPLDIRPDSEIIKSLTQYVAITSEKNVWAFWDKGVENMPGWCQRNVIGWVRMCSNGDKPWTVRVLDALPDSPNYALNFTFAEMLPQAFVGGKMEGPYIGPHSADFLRGALLFEHGGVFMDVSNILLRHLDRVCWDELEDPTSPYQVAAPLMYGQVIANHFVMARKGDPFVKKWHELFIHFWRGGRTSHKGIIDDPLLEFATKLDFSDSNTANYHWEFKVSAGEVFEYISQVLAWLRLSMLEEAGEDFSGSEYWQNHVLVFDALQEDWPAEATIGFNGKSAFDALSTRLDASPNSQEYKQAYELVWRMLSGSTMQKIAHGKHLTKDKSLGVLWDEHAGADCTPGTFAELLRYGAVHFEQTRTDITKVEAKKATQTMKKRLLEL